MTAQEKAALMSIRAQIVLVRRLQEQAGGSALTDLRSPSMDAPRGGGFSGGLERRLIRQEQLQRMLKREEASLRQMEQQVRAAMAGMRPELYAFCAFYYLNGMSLSEVQEALDRSERQCLRYRQEIEKISNEP